MPQRRLPHWQPLMVAVLGIVTLSAGDAFCQHEERVPTHCHSMRGYSRNVAKRWGGDVYRRFLSVQLGTHIRDVPKIMGLEPLPDTEAYDIFEPLNEPTQDNLRSVLEANSYRSAGASIRNYETPFGGKIAHIRLDPWGQLAFSANGVVFYFRERIDGRIVEKRAVRKVAKSPHSLSELCRFAANNPCLSKSPEFLRSSVPTKMYGEYKSRDLHGNNMTISINISSKSNSIYCTFSLSRSNFIPLARFCYHTMGCQAPPRNSDETSVEVDITEVIETVEGSKIGIGGPGARLMGTNTLTLPHCARVEARHGWAKFTVKKNETTGQWAPVCQSSSNRF